MIGSCTLGIKTPLQLKMLNVTGASCDLFFVVMDIYHGKFTSGNVGHPHKMQFPVVKGQFTKKVPLVTAPKGGVGVVQYVIHEIRHSRESSPARPTKDSKLSVFSFVRSKNLPKGKQ